MSESGRRPNTAVHRTSTHRCVVVQDTLLEHGADPNQRWCERTLQATQVEPACTIEKGITPVMFAAKERAVWRRLRCS